MFDFFDPNTWEKLLDDKHEYRIYLDNTGDLYAVVSQEDYQWAVQWRWCAKKDDNGKIYARRAISTYRAGKRTGSATVYLHVEIMRRMRKRRRSSDQVLVDHWNGQSLDCSRGNLKHASYSENNRNLFGRAYIQQSLEL